MATKKAPAKRKRQSAVKRTGTRKKTVSLSGKKKSARKPSSFLKARPDVVIVGAKSTFSPYAVRALSVFSAGVQRALEQLARRNIRAVVVENGKRIEAVPIKVDGRYVVVDSQLSGSDGRNTSARKRGVRIG